VHADPSKHKTHSRQIAHEPF